MKKLFFAFCSTVLLSVSQSSYAQKIYNNTSNSLTASLNQSAVFTSEGFINTPWSVEEKQVKTPTPVIQKKSFLKETREIIESLTSLQYKYAMLLNVNVESLKNTALLGFMDDWFGTKYRYGGTTKRGIDCSALTGSLLSSV